MFRAGGLVSSVLICGLSASEAICQIEQQEQSLSDFRRYAPGEAAGVARRAGVKATGYV